jgi:LacI family transcriptional regulator
VFESGRSFKSSRRFQKRTVSKSCFVRLFTSKTHQMTHRFPIKEIARQAGLGPASIDRVINNRAHVSPQTRTRVKTAIAELEGQEALLAARGRRVFFDFVIEAPSRFSREVKVATEQVVIKIGAAVCRPRFQVQEIMTETEVVKILERIAKRGSQGVCLKARDVPAVRQAVETLAKADIPVVTLVTNVRTLGRIAYVGLDNQNAGRTPAYLMATALGQTAGAILVIRSCKTRSNNGPQKRLHSAVVTG